MMISEALSWFMGILSLMFFWLAVGVFVLFLIAVVVYMIGYFWTLGRHRALLVALRDRQKDQQSSPSIL